MAEVQHFLSSRHPGRYRVYNLCSERSYPSRAFENRVALYGFVRATCPFAGCPDKRL